MKIDGKEIAKEVFKSLKARISKLKESNVTPHLVVILIGNDPASVSYVNQKKIKGKRIDAKISVKHLSSDTSEGKLLATIEQLNNDNNVHGIIVQRPLPINIHTNPVSLAIAPKKDVDGFHPNSKFQPPIALAVFRVLEEIYRQSLSARHSGEEERRLQNLLATERNGRDSGHGQNDDFITWLKSKKIVVIGKGETGGKPVIDMLTKMNIKPSIIDSKTPNSESITKKADIIISAVGKPSVIKPEMIKKNSILISIGLSKEKDGKLHGDYYEEKIKNIVSFYTPTPGGVGPVNVAMLLKNLVKAAENQYSQVSS